MFNRTKILCHPILLRKPFELVTRQNSKLISDLNCKVAVIYGGAGGIGHEIAHHFLAERAKNVVLLGLNVVQGKESIERLNHRFGHGRSMFIKSDILSEFNVQDSFKLIENEIGKIDIVVNSVGLISGHKWENDMITNYLGPFRSTWFAYKYMDKSRGGRGGTIINVAGVHGLKPLPSAPHMAGNSHGIIGYSRSFAEYFPRSGVRVICLCPGVTNTTLLEDLQEKGLDPEMGKELCKVCKSSKRQSPRVCGKAAVHLVKYAESGSIWVIEDSCLFKVSLPYWKNYSVLVSQIL